MEATLAAEAGAHRELAAALQRQAAGERKGQALVKLEESRAHIRALQGEAAQSRRREAAQARQREMEAEARACLERTLEIAKTEAAEAATRLHKLTGDAATLSSECDLDELRQLAAELDAAGAKVRRAVLDAEVRAATEEAAGAAACAVGAAHVEIST